MNFQKVRDTLLDMMSVRCPTSITKPRGSAYKEDHEDWKLGANVVADVMPFCGRVSTKNSMTLFNEGHGKPTVNLLFYGKVNTSSEAKLLDCFSEHSYFSYLVLDSFN